MNLYPLRPVPLAFLLIALLLPVAGCRTLSPLPAADFSEPGWQVQQGQAIWKSRPDAPEIAGELLLATHHDGRSFLQFSKTPFSIVVAQTATNRWEIQFVPEQRVFRGRGEPPQYFGWLHLRDALAGHALPGDLRFAKPTQSSWRLESAKTGEWIEGYFLP